MSWILLIWFNDGKIYTQPETIGTFDSLVQCEMTLERIKSADKLRFRDVDGICIPARLER